MLIQFALTLTVLLGFCGLVLDVAYMEIIKLQVQNAADAAAVAAAYNLGSGSTAWTQAAKADAALNGFTDGVKGASVAAPVHPTTGAYANNNLAISESITQATNSIFFTGSTSVGAQATALAPAGGCVYLMSQASQDFSLSVTGSTTKAQCATYLGLKYSLDGTSSATGAQVAIASDSSGSNGNLSPTPILSIPQQADPLAKIAPPAVGPCSTAPKTFTTSGPLIADTYCGDIKLTSGQTTATYQLYPGDYIFTGTLTMSNAVFIGSGITIYMASGAGQAQISSSTLQISAPTSGPRQGIIFYSDRGMPSNQTVLTMTGLNSASRVDGIIYAPNQQVQISQSPSTSGTLQGNKYFGIVADRLLVSNSNIQFSSDFSSLQASPLPLSNITVVQ